MWQWRRGHAGKYIPLLIFKAELHISVQLRRRERHITRIEPYTFWQYTAVHSGTSYLIICLLFMDESKSGLNITLIITTSNIININNDDNGFATISVVIIIIHFNCQSFYYYKCSYNKTIKLFHQRFKVSWQILSMFHCFFMPQWGIMILKLLPG